MFIERVRVLSAEAAGDSERNAHIVYRIRVEAEAAPTMTKRFSSFLDLLARLSKESGAGGERGSAAAQVVDNWKRQLTIEKRHTGKASRADAVVNGRVALLQRMLDEFCLVPELAHSTGFQSFLSG